MYRLSLSLLALLAALAPAAVGNDELEDLYFGEALYRAYQGYYFDALERLDAELAQHYALDEPTRDSLYPHREAAEFSVGDFELNYRMHHRAGRAITAVLEGDVDEAVRNEAAFRLARIHFQKGQMNDALHALGRIRGRISEEIRDEVSFLRANIHLALGEPAKAAEVLRPLQGTRSLSGFSEYNLGIALLRDGRTRDALQQLDRAGQIKAGDQATLAIRDKANLVLGTLYMESGSFEHAKSSLDRVRLQGPMSNQALLSAGWADASAQRFERALVPWSLLADRETTDSAVQEALLALPFAYSQLEVHGRAAVLYGRALESFGNELYKLDASIDSIRKGNFLKALVRKEIHQDKSWVIRLRALPETPETYYLSELLASHDFQTALSNYLDLEELRSKLAVWKTSFDAFDDLIEARHGYYDPLLPEIDGRFRELDSRIRLRRQQHALLAERLQDLLVAPRPEVLATVEERLAAQRLVEIEAALGDSDAEARLNARVQRLKGVLIWSTRTDYHNRLTRFYRHLEELEDAVAVMEERYTAFVRVRQAATHSYVGYDIPIKRLRTRVDAARAQVALLMARQGRLLELVAIAELDKRKRRLERYQDQARYALADSYDRATNARTGAEVQP